MNLKLNMYVKIKNLYSSLKITLAMRFLRFEGAVGGVAMFLNKINMGNVLNYIVPTFGSPSS